MIKCALIGYGYWGKIIEKYIKKNSSFNLVKVVDPALDKDIKLSDVLCDKSIEVAFVCNPINYHYETVKQLLKHGKHVFCEKPLCKKYDETKELYNIARNNGLVLFTDYIYTVSPAINLLKQNISKLGNVEFIEASIKQFGNFYRNDNVFEVLGVHMLSAIIYIFGGDFSVDDLIIKKIHSTGIVESGIIQFRLGNTRGIIDCDLLYHEKERKITIKGKNGLGIFDALSNNTFKLIIHEEDTFKYIKTNEVVDSTDENNNIDLVLDAFISSIKSGTDNMELALKVASAMDNIKNMKGI